MDPDDDPEHHCRPNGVAQVGAETSPLYKAVEEVSGKGGKPDNDSAPCHQPPAKPEAWKCEPLKAVGSLAT
jgi:hypothetical protein